jgi:glutaredoxin 3
MAENVPGFMMQQKAYKPFLYPWAVELAAEHEDIHWTEKEVDLGPDVVQWHTVLGQDDRDFLTDNLRLFTQSDVQVGSNYYQYLIPSVCNNEFKQMLGSFAAREGVHQRAYALVSDTLGFPDAEYSRFLDYKSMSDKIDFMFANDVSTPEGVALAFAKTALCEGISLFGPFTQLLGYQRIGWMINTNNIVEWSIRDETVHVKGNSLVFRQMCLEQPWIVTRAFLEQVDQMTRQLVACEDAYLDQCFNGRQPAVEDMTAVNMKQYIRYIADRRLAGLGRPPMFKVQNPFPWLEWIVSGTKLDNFFEKRVSEYSIGGMTGDWGYAFPTA